MKKNGIAIIERKIGNQKFILIQEKAIGTPDEKGLLELPSGEIKEDEQAIEALKREVKAMTGLSITTIQTDNDEAFFETKTLEMTEMIHFQTYICEATGVHLTKSDQYKNIRWISLGVLKKWLQTPEKIANHHFDVLTKYTEQCHSK
ncbi:MULTISPECIES: NUDIX hydrolase [Carnobacterium]|uniref:NUDIX domain protein n=1 Tax=Carnobacterium maltaromaticum LMA28 TaxID=1234679 RepID=K8EF47_CARML|nr:NUDIX domain-containing protein [Carnobacterium maltaromaticum]AOA01363.1 NUDIX hydrolase [Carnobacterium maltaromaticum]KRN60274.1 hypothetical protein IV70_GL000996 [Carnobacterium maltaromaticum DSM 20342]MCI1819107.1 NUDIX domain-containing protein [Carnobacterium maltaromaticum]CCO10403.2 NUDIX domain protein [Carnobacterium maltaromaticum LMA28]